MGVGFREGGVSCLCGGGDLCGSGFFPGLLRVASSASDSLTLYKLEHGALSLWLKLLSLRLGQREACQLSMVAELWFLRLLCFLLHA